MIELVIGSDSRRLELHHNSTTVEINKNDSKYLNNKQILNYKWIEVYNKYQGISLESLKNSDSIHLESNFNKYINKYDNKTIPFHLLYPNVYDEVMRLIQSEGPSGCLIVSEVDFLVEEFCIFLSRLSRHNYVIDLSKFIYSDITSTYILDDNLIGSLSNKFCRLNVESKNPITSSKYSIEDDINRFSEVLKYYIPHLPGCNVIALLSIIKSKNIYTFEDYILLITIHGICISLIRKYDNEDIDKIFSRLSVMGSSTDGSIIDTNIVVTIYNICTFGLAFEIDDKSLHIHQMMDLLMIYMKFWKDLDLPIKFILPFEKFDNNPIQVLASSDLIDRFMRPPFPLMRWQRQILFKWKLGNTDSNLIQLIDSSNGLSVAEVLNLPIMRGWDRIEFDRVIKIGYKFDYMELIKDLDLHNDSHIVIGVSGMGKTNYAIDLAKRLNVPFVRFSVIEYLRPEIGVSEKEISKFFKSLNKYNSGDISCVLLLESLDSVVMYNITSIISRELNNILSNNYWSSNNRMVIIVTLMGNFVNFMDYPMIKNFKIIKLEPLNLDCASKIIAQMLNDTFDNSEQIIQRWKELQSIKSFTISQIKDIVESAKMKSFSRMLEKGNVEDKMTLILNDLIN